MAQIDQLRHFLAVVEHGGFRRASEVIHLSQPALTKSIQRLEAGFGVELIDRSSRGARPTPFGEIVLAGARRILSDLAQTRREVALLRDFEGGTLAVGCDPYATGVLSRALAQLVTQHPMMRYEVEVGNWSSLREKLLDRRIDIHVGGSPEVHGPEISITEFMMEPVVFFCRPEHPLTRQKVVSIEDLVGYPRIGIEAPPEWRRWYADITGAMALSADTIHPRFAMANSWDVLKEIVRNSNTISGGPRTVVEAEFTAGLLVELVPQIPRHEPRGTIARLRDRILTPAAEALIQNIEGVVSDIGP